MQFVNGATASGIPGEWLKSSFSSGIGNCVEVTRLEQGDVAVRNSRFPDGPALVFTRAEMVAFAHGVKGSEFDQVLEM
ncbi:hypothetical protein FHS42_005818 [Streptomyces zagrosensis]|uniref:DUF397 domain-containing protein n=1 Tax=Streptomyces zagrosensis TaxID=1042984 RepID=A0A7W9QGC8_9ACTN|nr:DUF397 domain-containing protein [Streptomyces zagrosensis]MBB5938727.1 hypothetical protein [Streptomyces zagrosensis]